MSIPQQSFNSTNFLFIKTRNFLFIAFIFFSSFKLHASVVPNSWDTFMQLSLSGILKNNVPTTVANHKMANKGVVSFGAEKEGTTASITAVLGPNTKRFKKFVKELNGIGHSNRRHEFLMTFLDGLFHGDFAQSEVLDIDGKNLSIDYQQFASINLSQQSTSALYSIFKQWIELTHDRPFAFLKIKTRVAIYEGDILSPTLSSKLILDHLCKDYRDWIPHFGTPQKYIMDAVPAVDYIVFHSGWEIRFNPLYSYGEWEKMIFWFKHQMKKATKSDDLYEAPGHQRMVFPEMMLNKNERHQYKEKLAEVYRNIQAYIVLRGLAGKTGIMNASYKQIHDDDKVKSLKSWKGVVRLEKDRWGKYTQAIEIRAGTKDAQAQRFMEKTLAARVATNDWGDISPISSWKLTPNGTGHFKLSGSKILANRTYREYARRYGVKSYELKAAIKKIKDLKPDPDEQKANNKTDLNYLVPFWHWENAPYISEHKAQLLNNLTKDFILYLAYQKLDNFEQLVEALSVWCKAARITDDIEYYLLPKKFNLKLEDNSTIPSEISNIPMKLNFTGKFPIEERFNFSSKKDVGQVQWLSTLVPFNFKEKKRTIELLGKDLAKELGVSPHSALNLVEENELEGYFKFNLIDQHENVWSLKWVGSLKNYDSEGQIIPESVRKGYVQITTPSMIIDNKTIRLVHKVMDKNNIRPDSNTGHGKIQLDMTYFLNNPKVLARFIALFNAYSGTITNLFQNNVRLKRTPPATVSKSLQTALINFNSDCPEELMSILYNHQYFNNRIGQNTSSTQIDLTQFFQTVIPPRFINDAYSISAPYTSWRRHFKVLPNNHYINLKFFDSPQSAHDSLAHVHFVQSLLTLANKENPWEKSSTQKDIEKINLESFVNHPNTSLKKFKLLMKTLNLNLNDYIDLWTRSYNDQELQMRSKFYTSFSTKLKSNPIVDQWDQAVPPREINQSIYSINRSWDELYTDREQELKLKVNTNLQQKNNKHLQISDYRKHHSDQNSKLFKRTPLL